MDLGICKRAKFHVGFFLRRRGFPVDNNNKYSRQFIQVTFEMLHMSQVRLIVHFSWDGLEPILQLHLWYHIKYINYM